MSMISKQNFPLAKSIFLSQVSLPYALLLSTIVHMYNSLLRHVVRLDANIFFENLDRSLSVLVSVGIEIYRICGP